MKSGAEMMKLLQEANPSFSFGSYNQDLEARATKELLEIFKASADKRSFEYTPGARAKKYIALQQLVNKDLANCKSAHANSETWLANIRELQREFRAF